MYQAHDPQRLIAPRRLAGGRRSPLLTLGLATLLLTTLFLAGSASAQVPSDSVFSGFQPNGQFLLALDGQDLPKAEIFFSERSSAYLIIAPDLSSPLLINPRTRSVESVHLMKVDRKDDGSVDLLADAATSRVDSYRIDGQELAFTFKGQEGRLKPRPALVGFKDLNELLDYKPEYSRGASAYSPNQKVVDALRNRPGDIRVRTFFGSWCAACTRLLPNILRLEQDLGEANIQFEYYGLPSPPFDNDPEAKAAGVKGVPTGIVYVDGKEVARLSAGQWNQVEISLNQILAR